MTNQAIGAGMKASSATVAVHLEGLRETLKKLDPAYLLEDPQRAFVRAVAKEALGIAHEVVPVGRTHELSGGIYTDIQPAIKQAYWPEVASIAVRDSAKGQRLWRGRVLEYGTRDRRISERRWLRKARRRTASVLRRYAKQYADELELLWRK